MTQKERLVELLRKSQWTIKDFPDADLSTFIQKMNDWLADYLLANGVIVPPCKIGYVVYDIGGFPKIMKAEVETITTDGTEMSSVVCSQRKPYHRWFVNWCDLGKTVFLSREEAEQALGG